MNVDVAKYQTYRKLIEKLVFRGGIWPHREDTVFFYRIITFSGIFLTSSIGTKMLVFCLSSVGNVSLFVEALQNTLSAYAPFVRIINYLVYRSELASLDKELGSTFERELKNEKNRGVLLNKISLYSKFLYFLFYSTTITILFFCAQRFIYIFKYKKYIYLWPGKYPFPVTPNSPIYWALIAFETSVFYIMYHVTPGVDSAFGLHCFRISGLLRLAAQRFKNLDPGSSRYRDELKECVANHQLAIKSQVELQQVYGGIVLWNYCINAIMMCSLLWQAQQIKSQMTLAKLIYIMAFIIMKLAQTFNYAYCGAAITAESNKYEEAVYTSRWPGTGNVSLMKDLLIVLSQRTVTLKACGYFLITMELFEKIVNTTISYFFLIQSLEAKH